MHANIPITRRRLLALLGAGALWGLLPSCRRGEPLTVASYVWPGYEFMFMAQREGWLDPQRVQLRETSSGSETMKALTDGSVDAGALTLDEVLRLRGSGVRLSVALVFDISAGADVVLARPFIRELNQIKGKRIGVEQSALGALMLVKTLQAAGLRRDDVQVIPMTWDRHEAAWQRDEVDVVITFPPVSSRLFAAGAVSLFDSRQLPDTIVDVLAVRQQVLKQKRNAIRHLIESHLRGRLHLQRNPQDASYRMASHLGLHSKEVLASYKGLVLPDLASNRRFLEGDKPVLLDSAHMLSDVMVKERLLPRPDDLDALIYTDGLPEKEHED